jgi:HK97 family phage major capsid protein
MFNDSTLKALKKLKDSQNRPLFLPGYALNEPDTINGQKFYINQDMASMATGNKFMLAGAFEKYQVRRVSEIQLFQIRDKYIEQGSVGFLAYARMDARMLDAGTHPVYYMKNA